MKAIEYALVSVLACVVAYLVVTPIAHRTANMMNETTEVLQQYD